MDTNQINRLFIIQRNESLITNFRKRNELLVLEESVLWLDQSF